MKLILSAIFLLTSVSSFAFPMMNTKERVRMELWFEGVDHPKEKSKTQAEKEERPLPIELEQALLKF